MVGYQSVMPPTTTASAGVDETYTGEKVDVSDCSELTAVFSCGAGVTTLTRLDAWLQGSIDGTQWFDLSHDGARHTAAAAADAADRAVGLRNVIDNFTAATALVASAKYRNLNCRYVRAKAVLDVNAGSWNAVQGAIYGKA